MIYRSTSFQFDDRLKCDGRINYPWISPNDEANCSSQCRSDEFTPCDCNKPGSMNCEGKGSICYFHHCKMLVIVIKSLTFSCFNFAQIKTSLF